MNEIALSNDLNIITAEINSYKQVAGHSFIEIGRRLVHVKDSNLVHGDWKPFLESIQMSKSQADRFMKVSKEYDIGKLPDVGNIGMNAMYEIATLPDKQKPEALNDNGSAKTIQQIRELKRQNKEIEQAKQQAEQRANEAEQSNEQLGQKLTEERNKQPEPIEKEVIKEVVPENVQQELNEANRKLNMAKKEINRLTEEQQHYQLNNADFDEAEAEKQRKKLYWESERNVLEMKVHVDRFLENVSINAFRKGAIASSDEQTRKKLEQSVDSLKEFTKEIELALTGRVEIKN